MRVAVMLVGIFGLSALSGCLLVQEPEMREVAGPTDGYTPTARYLKVHISRDDGTVALLDFDRRDWYTAKIAELLDMKQARFVSAQAMPRDILGEYVAASVADPGEMAGLRYDDMDATPQQRARMDTEYEALLSQLVPTAPAPPPGETPLAVPSAPIG